MCPNNIENNYQQFGAYARVLKLPKNFRKNFQEFWAYAPNF
jgi:hypothetical protein